MAWKSKEAMVVVIDVGASMQETFSVVKDGSKVTRAQTALGVAQRLVQHRLFFTPKEEVGIVFFGTRDTQNDLQEDGEYRNIYVCRNRKIDVVDLEALRCLSETTAPKGGEVSDAVSALIVGLDMLIKRTKELKYKKSIKLITHEFSAPLGDPDLAECAKQLQVMGAELSVTLVGSSGKGAWAALQGEHLKVVSLPELLRDTELRVKPVEQRAKVRLALTISPEMDIPIGVYSKTTRVGFPTMKKQSKLAAAIPSEARKSDKVLPDRTYYATDDKEGEEVKKEDRVKGFKYGQNIVPMSEYDEAALSYSCDRTLTTLGFADAASVSPESSLHSVDVVAADKGDAWAHYAFESLVEAMLSEKRVLIARYCFRKDSQPRMVALIPKKGDASSSSHLVLQYMPFTEDLREWTCASLPEPTAEQKAFTNSLVDALTFDPQTLRPEETSNPSLARFYDFLGRRAVDPGAKLESSVAAPVLEMPEHARLALEKVLPENERLKVKASFGLEKVEKAVGRERKRFWRDAIEEKTRNAASIGEVDIKKIKVDAYTGAKKTEEKEEDKGPLRHVKGEESQEHRGDDSMAVPVGVPPRVHIGSVNPQQDFERWLNERKTGGQDVVTPAIEQMCNVILRFAEEGEEFHGKALGCLATLRRGCVREAEVAGYNEFLRKLRLRLTRRQGMLWERAAQDKGLGLITDAEVVTSTVTAEEAQAFLEGRELSGPTASSSASATAPDTASTTVWKYL
ncbi:unnamed protein product [Durusdinium trenchii]|uniref:Ku domain-containing protein n=1 Tax=Durusdinium trenchii TaxID=1381693 RepID=A0ABP0QQG0_9DINO